MSRSARSRTRTGRRSDDGFGLVEVIVALGILVVVMTALLPQLLMGIRSSATAASVTEAKGVAQGQLERMRNMPFHVARQAGPYLDVLDRYYTKLTPAPAVTCKDGDDYTSPVVGWSGYVTGTSSSSRCDYDPRTGPFYRYVVPHPASGVDPNEGFEVVVDTQFLDSATPPAPVTPPAGYDTQTADKDRPASRQIGVTVTVFRTDHGILRPVTTYTQIADLPKEVSRVKATADARAVEIGSVLPLQGGVSLEAGLLDLNGSLGFASEAGADLSAVSASLATGDQVVGAARTLVAPSGTQTASGAAGCLAPLACWGASQLDLGAVSSTAGLPTVGSATSPMQSRLLDTSLSFDNGTLSSYRPRLGIVGALVRMAGTASAGATGVTPTCAPGASGSPAYVRSSGFLRTTAPSDSTVEACALSSASTLALFPTSFAPNGVVQVDLVRASARCVVSGTGHVAQQPATDYRAIVRYHVGTGPLDYVVAADITPAMTSDVLAGIDLSVDVDGPDGDHTLGDYVASWSGLVPSSIERTNLGGLSSVRLPGIVHITSTPMRGTEETPSPTTSPSAETSPSTSPTADPTADPTDGATVDPSAGASTEPTEEPTPDPVEVIDQTSAFTFSTGVVGCSALDAR